MLYHYNTYSLIDPEFFNVKNSKNFLIQQISIYLLQTKMRERKKKIKKNQSESYNEAADEINN